MTEVPEHLLRRAQAAKEKAAARGGPREHNGVDAFTTPTSTPPTEPESRIPAHLLERSEGYRRKLEKQPFQLIADLDERIRDIMDRRPDLDSPDLFAADAVGAFSLVVSEQTRTVIGERYRRLDKLAEISRLKARLEKLEAELPETQSQSEPISEARGFLKRWCDEWLESLDLTDDERSSYDRGVEYFRNLLRGG